MGAILKLFHLNREVVVQFIFITKSTNEKLFNTYVIIAIIIYANYFIKSNYLNLQDPSHAVFYLS